MPRPLNQFCCGCSLTFGVTFILTAHLIMNLFYIGSSTAAIIMHVPTMGLSQDLTTQILMSAFGLMGIPFIVAALYGMWYRMESHLRLYLYYMGLSLALDLGYVMYTILADDMCALLPSSITSGGAAFACGAARIFVISFLVVTTAIQVYFVFCVWSLCEDFRAGGVGSGFPLLLGSAVEARRQKYKGSYAEGFLGTGDNSAAMEPVNYGSLAAPGVGGSEVIFGGDSHDINYPSRGV